MNDMNTKEILIKGCQEIGGHFPDFKMTKNGRVLSKNSQNKLLKFSIYFETSMRNYNGSVSIVPYISIDLTKSFYQLLEPYQLGDDICIYHKSLGYLNPRQEYYEWNLAGASFEHSVHQIVEQLKNYALPIFELFEQPQQAIDFLLKHGTKFHAHIKELDLLPIYFILGMGTKTQAGEFFGHFINHCSYKGKFLASYQVLKMLPKDQIDVLHNDFTYENILKQMVVNDVEIVF